MQSRERTFWQKEGPLEEQEIEPQQSNSSYGTLPSPSADLTHPLQGQTLYEGISHKFYCESKTIRDLTSCWAGSLE